MTDVFETPEELERRLGVAAKTWANWRATGRGPAYTKAGKRVLYRRADVDAWLAENTIRPAAG